MIISATYDSSITSSPYATQIESAIQAAIAYFDNTITNGVYVSIDFGFGEVDGRAISAGAVGESVSNELGVSYADLVALAKAADSTSLVQEAAAAILPTSAPASAQFLATTAEYRALTDNSTITPNLDGFVGLNANDAYFWSQSDPVAGAYDAVGALEHEISEVLGRQAHAGRDIFSAAGQDDYSLLDLYRYTAAGDAASAAPGTAAGALDINYATPGVEPAQGYFSYNGSTITLAYATPAAVQAGYDPGDWAGRETDDSFGTAQTGHDLAISQTDLEELNVLGYTISDQATLNAPASLVSGGPTVPISLAGISMSDASLVGSVLTLQIGGEGNGIFTATAVDGAEVSGSGSLGLTIKGTSAQINAVLADAAYAAGTSLSQQTQLTISGSFRPGLVEVNIFSGSPVTLTVAVFEANRATIDAQNIVVNIYDASASIVDDLAALNADPNVAAIQPWSTPVFTVAELAAAGSALTKLVATRPAVADKAAAIETLTLAQIDALAAARVAYIKSTDASLVFTGAVASAIADDSIQVDVPDASYVRLNFSPTSSEVTVYGAGQAVVRRVVTNNDDTIVDVYDLLGVFQGVAYDSIQTAWTNSVVQSRTFYDLTGAVAAVETFDPNGGLTVTENGVETLSRTPLADGGYEVHHYAVSGTVDSLSYDNVDIQVTASGARASVVFYTGSTEVVSRAFNPDGTFEISIFAVEGATTALQRDCSATGGFLARSVDFSASEGQLSVFSAGLDVTSTGQIRIAGSSAPSGPLPPVDFAFTPHADETYALIGGTSDVIHFAAGFGTATVTGFSLAADDVLDVSGLFGSFSAVSMTSANGGTLIADGAGDTIAIAGVAPLALTAKSLGFA